MRNALLLPLLLVACGGGGGGGGNTTLPALQVRWARFAGGLGNTLSVFGMATALDGTFAVVGDIDGSATFGEGEPNETTLLASGIFVARYASDGAFLWARAAFGAGFLSPTAVQALPAGAVLVAGIYYDSITLGYAEPNETTLTGSATNQNVFLARYEADGSLSWATSAPSTSGTDGVFASDLAARPDGSCYVVGGIRGSAVFGEGEATETTLVAQALDAFVARYSPGGLLDWATGIGGTGIDRADSASTFSDGSVIVAGSWEGQCQFGPIIDTADGDDLFLLRLTTGGSFDGLRTVSGPGYQLPGAVRVRPDDSYVVLGWFEDRAEFGPFDRMPLGASPDDLFLAGYAPDDTPEWARAFGSRTLGEGFASLAVLPDRRIAVSGQLGDEIYIEGGKTIRAIGPDTGWPDAFVLLFSADGSPLERTRAGGSGWEQLSGLAAFPDGSIGLGGHTLSATLTLEPNVTRNVSGGVDSVLARLDPR
jgi:hypothetical protein